MSTSPYFFHIQEDSLADQATIQYDVTSDGASPLAVTLSWTDPPGPVPPLTAIDPPDVILVNDLDLRVEGPGATMFEPWVLDPANPANPATTGDNARDPVEQVWIETPAAGTYTVSVSHKGVLDGGGPQDFSLIVTGNIDPLIFGDGFESGDLSAWTSSVGGP